MEIRLIAYLLAFAGVLGGCAWIVHAHDNRVRAAQEAAYAAAALDATTKARAEEQRRTAAQKDINDETQRLASRARSDAVRVDAAAPGLRNAVAVACFRAGPGYPATVAGVASAASEPDLLTDVLGAAEDRLRGLAREADERGTAGTSCERKYDSLNVPSVGLGKLKLGG